MTSGTHYYKYRTRSRRDPADLQKQLGKIFHFYGKKLISFKSIVYKVYTRRDSMIWDFKGRRPLSVRDRVVSIKDGP